MISIGYVNNTLTPMTDAFFKEYTAEINDLYDDINFTCCEMALVEERVDIEQEITGSVNDTLMLEYEEKKKNFFQKIGEAIITIFEKVRAAIQSAIDKVKEIAFGSKSDLQKLDTLIKKHPELKDEVVCAFNSGALDMKDIKSLKELDAAFEEVMRMSKEKDIDPNTLKGKWEKAKKKFQEDEKTWNVSKIANVTKTVLTAGTVALTFGGVLKKNKDMLQESNAKNKALEAELEAQLRKEGAITDADPSTGKGGTGKWTALLQITRERNGYHDAARMKNLSLLERMQNGVAKVLDKFTSKRQTEKLFNDYDTERRINDAKKTQDHNDQVSLAADIETAKQNAQKPFKDADYKQHRKDQQDDYKQHRKDQQDDYTQRREDQQADYTQHRKDQQADYTQHRKDQRADYDRKKRDDARRAYHDYTQRREDQQADYKQHRKDQQDDYTQRRKDQIDDRNAERRYRQRIDNRKREQDKKDREDSRKITSKNVQTKTDDAYWAMKVKKLAKERLDADKS